MSRSQSHVSRNVTGRAFTVHLRCFAKNIEKLNRFLQEYRKEVESILFNLEGEQFDRRLGIKGMASEILRIESSSLEGVQAHAREIKVFSKYLGLIRPENMITSRGEAYLNALESHQNYLGLLAEYAMKIKLMCPLVRSYIYQVGQNQASYANYRIRPIVMTLYAIKQGKELGLEVDTDDIALTSLLFYPPHKQRTVTERFLKSKIDDYFARKSKNDIDYEKEFRSLYHELLAETNANPIEDEFRQKSRNSANNVWCFLIFLRDINLIDAEDSESAHWSSTRQIPESSRTFPVGYQLLDVTDLGEKMLQDSMNCVPVWHKDIMHIIGFSSEQYPIIRALESLKHSGRLVNSPDEHLVENLGRLGIDVSLDKDNNYVSSVKPIFEREYDIV